MSRKCVHDNPAAHLGRHKLWQQSPTWPQPSAVSCDTASERPSRMAQVMFGLLAVGVLAAPFVDTALRMPVRRGRGDGMDPDESVALRPKSSQPGRGLLGLPPPGSLPPMPHAVREPASFADAGCALVSAPKPCIEWLHLDQVGLALPEVQSILWGWRWRSCDWDACGNLRGYRSEAPNLAVQFSSVLAAPRDYYQSSYGQNTVPMDAQGQAMARRALANMERFVNIAHHEVPANMPGNLYFAQTGDKPDAGQSNVDGNQHAWVTTMSDYGHDLHTMFHETGHAHGFCHTKNMVHGGPDGFTPYFLPQDGWPENVLSSHMSYTAFPTDGYSPIDLASLAFLYGTAPALLGDTVHVLDAQSGRCGWHDDDGDNTLMANHTGSVLLDLNTQATSVSVIGAARVQLTPTSRFVVGDISLARGGILRGNGLDNILIGSAYDDVIASGAGNTDITTGTGHDTVVIESGAQVRVHDFDPQNDRLATSLRPPSPITLLSQTEPQATVVLLPSGERATLLGVPVGAIDGRKIVQGYTLGSHSPGGALSPSAVVGIAVGASVGGTLALVGAGLGITACVRRRRAAAAVGGLQPA